MTFTYQSRLTSILLSTACLVAFGLLEGPVMKPPSGIRQVIGIREAVSPATLATPILVSAGKSVIVDSPSGIVRASVDNPALARAVAINAHELLLNGTVPGRTKVTLWEEDGNRERFELNVESGSGSMASRKNDAVRQVAYHGVAASYENAMDRIQTVITGVAQ
jgi:Flp pilus assembly secretin CpaC